MNNFFLTELQLKHIQTTEEYLNVTISDYIQIFKYSIENRKELLLSNVNLCFLNEVRNVSKSCLRIPS